MYIFNNLSDIKGREEEFFNKEISIKGKIFYVDEAKDFYYLFVTDYSYSFLCKLESWETLRTVSRKGEWFRFEGVLEYDSEMGSYCLNVDTVKVAVPLSWHDLSVEKRVELHAHSKMSSKLSILDMEELVDAVSSFGQKAVAITV
ncbi:MAG: hypothetical protein WC188_10725 [Candidatus Caldatribacteriota bacterium]